nr:cytochrome c family protein [Shinella sp. HZN7]
MATADATAGETAFKKCASCHTSEKGGPNKVGPGLWDIVNRPVASHEGFSYSAGMTTFSEGQKVVWDYDHLSYFLEAPKKHVPGTAMGFAGLKKNDERANLIAYLRTLSDNPAPLPTASSEGADAGAAAPADGATSTEGAAPADGAATTTEGAAPAEGGDDDRGRGPGRWRRRPRAPRRNSRLSKTPAHGDEKTGHRAGFFLPPRRNSFTPAARPRRRR